MFTGIIEQTGKITAVADGQGQRRMQIQTAWKDLLLGESISVNGVCLTVAEGTAQGEAHFFVSEESLSRSSLGGLLEGQRVNLERAMGAGGRFGGHIVQGHVDTKAKILEISEGPDHWKLQIALPLAFGRYCVEKGSIALDGVSLTINAISEAAESAILSFLLIPHTWKHTAFSERKAGDELNIEVDILAKYIEKLCKPSQKL